MVIRLLLLLVISQVNKRIDKSEQNSRNILAKKNVLNGKFTQHSSLSKHPPEFGYRSKIGYFLRLSSVGNTPLTS